MKDIELQMYKESLPLYRHKELYEWNEQYQDHKFFTEKDFEEEKRIAKLKIKGYDDYNDSHYKKCLQDVAIPWRYENRYCALKQSTVFFKNLVIFERIKCNAESYPEFVLKAAVRGIDQKYVNFYILYVWFAKNRFFSYHYWDDDYKPSPNDGHDQWLKFCKMRKEAFKNGHLNCCKYSEFIEHEFK